MLGFIEQYRLWLLAAALAAAFAAGWAGNGWRMGEQLAMTEKSHSAALGEIARAGEQQYRDQVEKRAATEQQLAALDLTKHKELTDAQAENDRLRDLYSVADGERKWLRIEVRRASAAGGVSGSTSAGGVGDGASVELSERAGSAVWHIRGAVISDQAKLAYLQGYVCKLNPKFVGCSK